MQIIKTTCIFFCLLFSLSMSAIQVDLDIAFGSHDKQKLDVYWNPDTLNAAIFINIHGGAWIGGDKSEYGSVEKAGFFDSSGCILVSPNYRLLDLDTDKARDLIQDVWMAAAYIRRHAAEYNAVPDKIFVGGGSAGGHLSAAIAYCQNENWLAGTEYDGDMEAVTKSIIGFWGESPAVNWDVGVKPSDHIDPNEPPAFITQGDSDITVNINGVYTFTDELEKNNIDYTMLVIPGGGHVDGRDAMWSRWEDLEEEKKKRFGSEKKFLAWKDSLRTELSRFITGILEVNEISFFLISKQYQPLSFFKNNTAETMLFDLKGRFLNYRNSFSNSKSIGSGIYLLYIDKKGSRVYTQKIIAE